MIMLIAALVLATLAIEGSMIGGDGMLTYRQRRDFCRLTGEYNVGFTGKGDELAQLCSPEDVGATWDTVDEFVKVWGDFSDAVYNFYIWENVRRPGPGTYGTLFVMDFGDVRGVYFDQL